MPISDSNDEDINKNAPFRSSRRAAHKGRASSGRKERRLTVRSELRDEPDVRKIARAIIAMAMAEAEREAEARLEREQSSGKGDAGE